MNLKIEVDHVRISLFNINKILQKVTLQIVLKKFVLNMS